jgi:hypothetical protein
MMRHLLGILSLLLLPSVAAAEDVKRPTLADYVGLCLSMWDNAADVPTKVSALGLQNATGGTSNFEIKIEKTVMRFYKSAQGPGTVGAFFTTMEGGKESSCDINLPIASERADLDAMVQALDLDGQILAMGATTMAYWKIRKREPAVLIRSVLNKGTTTLMLVRFEPNAAGH